MEDRNLCFSDNLMFFSLPMSFKLYCSNSTVTGTHSHLHHRQSRDQDVFGDPYPFTDETDLFRYLQPWVHM